MESLVNCFYSIIHPAQKEGKGKNFKFLSQLNWKLVPKIDVKLNIKMCLMRKDSTSNLRHLVINKRNLQNLGQTIVSFRLQTPLPIFKAMKENYIACANPLSIGHAYSRKKVWPTKNCIRVELTGAAAVC